MFVQIVATGKPSWIITSVRVNVSGSTQGGLPKAMN